MQTLKIAHAPGLAAVVLDEDGVTDEVTVADNGNGTVTLTVIVGLPDGDHSESPECFAEITIPEAAWDTLRRLR